MSTVERMRELTALLKATRDATEQLAISRELLQLSTAARNEAAHRPTSSPETSRVVDTESEPGQQFMGIRMPVHGFDQVGVYRDFMVGVPDSTGQAKFVEIKSAGLPVNQIRELYYETEPAFYRSGYGHVTPLNQFDFKATQFLAAVQGEIWQALATASSTGQPQSRTVASDEGFKVQFTVTAPDADSLKSVRQEQHPARGETKSPR